MFGEPHGARPAIEVEPLIDAPDGRRKSSKRRAWPTRPRSKGLRRLARAGADFVALDEAIWSAAPSPPRQPVRLMDGSRILGRAAMTRLALALALCPRPNRCRPGYDRGAERERGVASSGPVGFRRARSAAVGVPPRADGKPPDMAFAAYQRGNFLAARKEVELGIDANSRDAAAMTLIGLIYHDGDAVGRDELEASRWWRLASNVGNPQAAPSFRRCCCRESMQCSRNPPPRRSVRAGGGKGHAGKLSNLGVLALDNSNGRKSDFTGAAQDFLRAAKAGDDNAAYSYGVMVREGKGVPRTSPRGRIGSGGPPTAALWPARSNTRSCCSTARAWRRTKPARSKFF